MGCGSSVVASARAWIMVGIIFTESTIDGVLAYQLLHVWYSRCTDLVYTHSGEPPINGSRCGAKLPAPLVGLLRCHVASGPYLAVVGHLTHAGQFAAMENLRALSALDIG